ncbi:MAG: hypothetical protein ACRDMZ_00980, partial [Solirubrobacteraceae bacterium]
RRGGARVAGAGHHGARGVGGMTTIEKARPSRRLRRGVLRLGSPARRAEPHRVVRVELGAFGRTYAYRCSRAVALGQLVRVHARVEGWTVRPVVGFGRHGYVGPLKDAVPVDGAS